ncbi:MAG: diaminohydroxyphosphoribosylaminopyrimidine deaminase [Patiriisocius sp.]|jgi:diaminohydroxyphosphoribosylaminopyrimidine deaminase/5-amino-6-(5-phosphoribosylamino)uracil reductase
MRRCIQLAENGLGNTYPNPLVGSVLVYNDTIIGEGWHHQAGQAHAEVHAITNVQTNANATKIIAQEAMDSIQELLSKTTIYVSLEPCSHVGRTPPCANLIIASGIKSVVVGSTDPNPKVAGKGLLKLKEAGCSITLDVLEAECNELNKRFFTFLNKKRPYVFLKWAQTKDGYIAPKSRKKRAPVWITNVFSRQQVHQLRTKEQGIVVGTTTVLLDNPSLTARDWFGHNPTRIILDRSLKIPNTSAIYNDKASTIIITEMPVEEIENPTVIVEMISFQKNLASQICAIAYKHKLQSIIIEGGSQTLQTFIDESIWDEALVYTGKVNFENGIKAPCIPQTTGIKKNIKNTHLSVYKNKTQ